MIIRPRPHWLRMLFIVRGSVLPKIAPQLIFTTAIATLVMLAHGRVFAWKVALTMVPFSLIGLTLAIFLAFRNNTSYARFWDARILWTTFHTASRSLVRQATNLCGGGAIATPIGYRLIGFVHAVRHELRGSRPEEDLRRVLGKADYARVAMAVDKPTMLLKMAGEWVAERRREGLEAPIVAAMEHELSRLTDALGGCERISNTPIPFTYGVIIHRTIYLYCLLLPFALVDSLGNLTPFIVAFVAYTFFALEALGEEIEEPFGTEPNDLALYAMSMEIETSVRETLGEKQLPVAPAPARFVLN